MLRNKLLLLLVILVCVGIGASVLAWNSILAAPSVPDAPDEGLSIPWWTVDTGGGASQGGAYSLNGTAGQAEAAILTGGAYTLRGGYWGGSIDYMINLPLVVR